MPTPATTGQLRNTVDEMKIGDYIVCNYQASSGKIGTFSNFGGEISEEIPINGSEEPNGSFYLIKVDKGLLISDRVIQNRISWDTINGARFIEGAQTYVINFTDAVPTMTSDNTPSGQVRTSGVYQNNVSAYGGWRAFNDQDSFNGSYTTHGWLSSTSIAVGAKLTTDTCWISYEFPEPKEIRLISLVQLGFNTVTYRCKDFAVQCSDDGIVWENVYIGIAMPTFDKQYFSFDSVGAKKFWRFVIYSHNGGGPSNLGISQLEFSEDNIDNIGDYKFIVRSLSGGVTYSDKYGNKSTDYQGYGGWPVNNEWDTYIANFPKHFIQHGKGVDDVFHHLSGNVWTWCRDTAMIGMDGNTSSDKRILRGRNREDQMGMGTYNIASEFFGFRPVFEYKEV